MEEKFQRKLAALESVFEFLNRFMTAHDVDGPTAFSLTVAVEEFFTNMVKYDAQKSGTVTIRADREGENVVIRLIDHDVDRFDITRMEAVNVERPLGERKIGGLGIHIAKQLVDSLTYDYAERTSRITLVKRLEK